MYVYNTFVFFWIGEFGGPSIDLCTTAFSSLNPVVKIAAT